MRADGDAGAGERDTTPLRPPGGVTAPRAAAHPAPVPPAEGHTRTVRAGEAVRS